MAPLVSASDTNAGSGETTAGQHRWCVVARETRQVIAWRDQAKRCSNRLHARRRCTGKVAPRTEVRLQGRAFRSTTGITAGAGKVLLKGLTVQRVETHQAEAQRVSGDATGVAGEGRAAQPEATLRVQAFQAERRRWRCAVLQVMLR